jgi:hypothetical protein
MTNHEAVAGYHDEKRRLIIPIPIALYVSDGLVFELYGGGQPPTEYHIRWQHLKPIQKLPAPSKDDGD